MWFEFGLEFEYKDLKFEIIEIQILKFKSLRILKFEEGVAITLAITLQGRDTAFKEPPLQCSVIARSFLFVYFQRLRYGKKTAVNTAQ